MDTLKRINKHLKPTQYSFRKFNQEEYSNNFYIHNSMTGGKLCYGVTIEETLRRFLEGTSLEYRKVNKELAKIMVETLTGYEFATDEKGRLSGYGGLDNSHDLSYYTDGSGEHEDALGYGIPNKGMPYLHVAGVMLKEKILEEDL